MVEHPLARMFSITLPEGKQCLIAAPNCNARKYFQAQFIKKMVGGHMALCNFRGPESATLPCAWSLNNCKYLFSSIKNSTQSVSFLKYTVSTEKKIQHLSCELSFGGQIEEYSPGDSTLDNSAKLLQKDWGEGQYMCDFGDGRVHVIKHINFVESFY